MTTDSMGRERQLRWWDKLRFTPPTLMPSAPLPGCHLKICSWFLLTAPRDSKPGMKSRPISTWSGLAPSRNATILYVYTGSNSSQNVFNALEYAIDNNLAPVITTSYGNCEANLGSFTATLRADVQQANSQGQTVTAASGDAGAADCETQTAKSATHGLAVDSPASVPEVTALGGSEFTGDATSTVTGGDAVADPPFWGGTTGGKDNVSSALIYIPEMAWNDTAASIATSTGGLSATGGGVSTVFGKPAWQTALTLADGHRDVPDVSLTASPNHDGSLICSQAAVTS